ncbi:hypothetical protein ACFX13_027286 [Malus domestica]
MEMLVRSPLRHVLVGYGQMSSHHYVIFDWMQSKLTGKARIEKPSLKVFKDEKMQQKPSKEEANEWPHGLLAIGTLGNGDLKHDQQTNPPPSPNDHLHDFTPEEATHIQNELSSYWNQSNLAALLELEKAPNKFLSKRLSLKPERTSTDNVDCDQLPKENMSRFQRSSSVVLRRGKDVCLDNTNSTIGKKSLSFLLKKVFFCSSGFALAAAAPGLRDPVPDSRMEKILRAILHKKIYPQSSSTSTMSMKKYLENSNPKSAKANEESKWDKTDSEYLLTNDYSSDRKFTVSIVQFGVVTLYHLFSLFHIIIDFDIYVHASNIDMDPSTNLRKQRGTKATSGHASSAIRSSLSAKCLLKVPWPETSASSSSPPTCLASSPSKPMINSNSNNDKNKILLFLPIARTRPKSEDEMTGPSSGFEPEIVTEFPAELWKKPKLSKYGVDEMHSHKPVFSKRNFNKHVISLPQDTEQAKREVTNTRESSQVQRHFIARDEQEPRRTCQATKATLTGASKWSDYVTRDEDDDCSLRLITRRKHADNAGQCNNEIDKTTTNYETVLTNDETVEDDIHPGFL